MRFGYRFGFHGILPCGDKEIDLVNGVDLPGDPERGIVADVFVTVGGMFLVFRSELRPFLKLVNRYLCMMSLGFTESVNNVSVLLRLRGSC